MIEKNDIKDALNSYEKTLFDMEASVDAMKQKVIFAKNKILEMVDDPIPEEAKDIVDEAKK